MPESVEGADRYESGVGGGLLAVSLRVFERQKALADHAIGQMGDRDFFIPPGPGLNSVAVLMRHMSGNIKSRWTDFLTTDGEKEWRDRDEEFVPPEPETVETRESITREWDAAWRLLFETLRSLTPDDLGRDVPIRGVPHSVEAAIVRQIDHLAGHVGQIAVIARTHVGTENWTWFTIAPGGTRAFNERLRDRAGGAPGG
ncbi:MAG: DUF1572 family protein [Planctomycetota bacterium]